MKRVADTHEVGEEDAYGKESKPGPGLFRELKRACYDHLVEEEKLLNPQNVRQHVLTYMWTEFPQYARPRTRSISRSPWRLTSRASSPPVPQLSMRFYGERRRAGPVRGPVLRLSRAGKRRPSRQRQRLTALCPVDRCTAAANVQRHFTSWRQG
jgi:hypothetical protein